MGKGRKWRCWGQVRTNGVLQVGCWWVSPAGCEMIGDVVRVPMGSEGVTACQTGSTVGWNGSGNNLQ